LPSLGAVSREQLLNSVPAGAQETQGITRNNVPPPSVSCNGKGLEKLSWKMMETCHSKYNLECWFAAGWGAVWFILQRAFTISVVLVIMLGSFRTHKQEISLELNNERINNLNRQRTYLCIYFKSLRQGLAM
jgi:hypothetical protein